MALQVHSHPHPSTGDPEQKLLDSQARAWTTRGYDREFRNPFNMALHSSTVSCVLVEVTVYMCEVISQSTGGAVPEPCALQLAGPGLCALCQILTPTPCRGLFLPRDHKARAGGHSLRSPGLDSLHTSMLFALGPLLLLS